MALIILENVYVGFPILHLGHRSLKKSLVANLTGGAIIREAHKLPYVRALNNVNLTIKSGDRVGIIGANGAGKTTLLRTLGGVYEPAAGRIVTEGRLTTLLDISVGFHQEMTGRENIEIRAMYGGLTPDNIRKITPEIEEFTELGDYLDMPIRTYSSGMQLRLAFAILTSVHPDILLMDEWVLAGDASFLNKAHARLERFVTRSSIMVLASHSDEIIRKWCNKALLLSSGNVLAYGPVDGVIETYHRSTNKIN